MEQPAESGYLPEHELLAARQQHRAGAGTAPSAPASRWPRLRGSDRAARSADSLEEQPPESGVVPEEQLSAARSQLSEVAATVSEAAAAQASGISGTLYHPREQSQIRESWRKIMRWSREFKVLLHNAA